MEIAALRQVGTWIGRYCGYPQYIGVLRPHIGHKIICVQDGDIAVVRCADCGENLTGPFHSPLVLAMVANHLGHDLTCVSRDHEVLVFCENCHAEVIGSTPF